MPEAKQAFQFGEQFRGELTILGGRQRFQELYIRTRSQAELGLRTRMRGQIRGCRVIIGQERAGELLAQQAVQMSAFRFSVI